MFDGATSFDQDISGWGVASLMIALDMFSGVQLSTANYDALLIGWEAQSLHSSVIFDGGLSTYCIGEIARANMISSDNWTITDGGKECPVGNFLITVQTDNPGSSASNEFPQSPPQAQVTTTA